MIKDSGNRTEFSTGAVRDIQEGKGRCDLLPFEDIADTFPNMHVLRYIGDFRRTGDKIFIHAAILKGIKILGPKRPDEYTPGPDEVLELAIHYEEGAKKYGDRNWEKGIPLSRYVDSGVRHYLKALRGDTDENHYRAFMWNMFGLLWTYHNRPEMDDFTIKEENTNDK